MRASFLISAVALLMVGAAAPALALSKGDCYVELPLDTGAFVGLDSGKFEKTVRFADANGRNRTTKVTVNQKSADNSQRGAVTGKIAIVFPAGSICNFTNDSLNKKNAAYPDLVKALTGLTVGGYTNGSFGGEILQALIRAERAGALARPA
ncbi:hypothetical protein MNEG_15028 [Monoraphidium neglectum]|uniref:Uncharacterized protein n=1 Tax=Monoraphidium neglectum TaxID=145388 RepID=A0A0D2LT59_9CHLO|nr:hypothetical protein MNEG_15028 [Monoraphidium neglectum]KIY92936.1 hypothetical protein MNEG_15028 [Monoraphidium neglectum]|eukprot:XP_013891956.1 hypothetical protein MNEG_15028 [Monoraphidium neglectum]